MNEIDQKELKQIEKEFLQLSKTRFDRMLLALTQKQQDYLRLLPLFFHVNHPMLPGYFDSFTPCGIPNYSPTSEEKKLVKTVSQSFDYEAKAHPYFSIASLFLMGSMGTLGQSVSSDIDLWVCFTEELSSELKIKLQSKCENIKIWFAKKGVELNYYLVNQNDFNCGKKGNLTKDNSGNTQRFLLLDEFYRTAVWLVGRKPLWWLVPESENYKNYSERLIKQKHVDEYDWIDFGEVEKIPATEYFTSALWQLYKSIESPYKSFVKLMALEVYAQNYPCGGILSSQLKSTVHSKQLQTSECDPYLMLLKFAEASSKQSPQKLDFLRRSFYLKSGIKIKNIKQNIAKSNWRYQLMQSLVKEWKWNESTLIRLNNRPNWKVDVVVNERKDLIRELTSCYYFLSNFARVQGVMNKNIKNDLTHLGRQLYASFERRIGKIDYVNNGIAKNIVENTVTLSECDGVWTMYQEQIAKETLSIHEEIFVSNSLFECLSWGCINKVIGLDTHFHLYTNVEYFDQDYTKQTVREITTWLSIKDKGVVDNDFSQPAKTKLLGIFINTGFDPLLKEKDQNQYLIADNSDYLSLSSNKTNLASSFHVLSLNNWGEIDLEYYSGNLALPELFGSHKEILCSTLSSKPSFFCHGLLQANEIIERLSGLLETWSRTLALAHKKKIHYFYLMQIGDQLLSLKFAANKITPKLLPSKEKLLNSVNFSSDENIKGQSIKVVRDPYLSLAVIEEQVLIRRANKNHQCFVSENSNGLIKFIFKSNQGAITIRKHSDSSVKQLIAHYQQFFLKAENRLGDLRLLEVDYFKLQTKVSDDGATVDDSSQTNSPQPKSEVKLVSLKKTETNFNNFKLVQAIKVRNHTNPLAFNFYTSDKDYLFNIHQESVFTKLVKDILAKRQNREEYPVYITDLDLGQDPANTNIVELLNIKADLEYKLNLLLSKINQPKT